MANTGVVSFLVNVDRDSWVHRLDPRSKVALLMFFSIIPLFFTDYRFIFAYMLLVLPLWLTSKLDFRPLRGPLVGVAIFLFILFAFTSLRGASELTSAQPEARDFTWFVRLGPIVVTSHTFFRGLYIAARAAVPMTIGLLIVSTTDPTNLGKGLRKLKMPTPIVFMVLAGLRFVPIVTEQMVNILDAMSIRGVSGSRIERTKLLVLPLFVTSLRRTRTMGLATEAKGFGADRWNDFYQEFKFTKIDSGLLVALLVLTAVSVYVRFGLGLGLATVGWTR